MKQPASHKHMDSGRALTVTHNMISPSLQQFPPVLDRIRPRIGAARRRPDQMTETHLRHFVGSLSNVRRPIFEAGPESVNGCRVVARAADDHAQRIIRHRLASVSRKDQPIIQPLRNQRRRRFGYRNGVEHTALRPFRRNRPRHCIKVKLLPPRAADLVRANTAQDCEQQRRRSAASIQLINLRLEPFHELRNITL